MYVDSTGLPDQTYKYGVAVIDTNNTMGIMSVSTSIVIATYFHVDTSFGSYGSGPGQFENISGFTIDRTALFMSMNFMGTAESRYSTTKCNFNI